MSEDYGTGGALALLGGALALVLTIYAMSWTIRSLLPQTPPTLAATEMVLSR